MSSFRSIAACAFAACLLAASPARGQDIGARGGVNLPTIRFDNPALFEIKANVGWLAGGYVTFLPTRRVGIQIEGLISRRVVTFDGAIDDALTYVEIPALVRVGVYRGNRVAIHALAGVSMNVLLAASEKFNGATAGDITATLQPWELAVVVGADARLKNRWSVGFRYLYGLTQVYRAHAEFPATQRSYEITFAYRLR